MTTLSTILLGFEDAAVSIASFLSAKDIIGLHTTNRGWHNILAKHEESFFQDHLKRDFVEGTVLSYVANQRNVPCKKVYLAFLKRWSLPKAECDGVGEERRVSIPWTRPHIPPKAAVKEINDEGDNKHELAKSGDGSELGGGGEDSETDNCKTSQSNDNETDNKATKTDDSNALVFIGRVGNVDDPASCILMDWKDGSAAVKSRHSKLCIDWDAYVTELGDIGVAMVGGPLGDGLTLPENNAANDMLKTSGGEGWYDRFCDALRDSHHITLHVLDIQTCQVVSLMDKTPFEDRWGVDLRGGDPSATYGFDLPKLYGIPPK